MDKDKKNRVFNKTLIDDHIICVYKNGWGGRTRTYNAKDQNLVLYH